MEIERINENTVKFYISYLDIEDRGFNREEIWYNRERSEQLFWQVMEEADNKEDDFDIDGPLWIQVQAMEKGLEITVTKAQISKDGQNLELPIESSNIDKQFDDKLDELLDNKFGQKSEDDLEDDEVDTEDVLINIIEFADFEDVIQLSYGLEDSSELNNTVYHYQNSYYLVFQFDNEELSNKTREGLISRIFEYGRKSSVASALIIEYGKVIFEDNGLEQVKEYFNR
ncbi:adapter protein MecA 1/2 [Amphibacillus marinus]|uniref:Adapter protein MecA n=1 Tax=Amphibacillus marinus TaxID=872970 RepID=A0A1H8Q9U4_9BACI|nr:adaptor protein MecA [Amphibacillus marinus]SEO50826.1 adapter protein MecA 1/2 [Amphibacillus marinus]